MTKINNMRAQLLHEKFGSNAASSFSEMASQIMKTSSYTEKECCFGTIRNSSIIYLNSTTFNRDLKNLEQAIKDNFPPTSSCTQCKRSPRLNVTFGPQLLIEVRMQLFRVHAIVSCQISYLSFIGFCLERNQHGKKRRYFIKCSKL